MTEEIIINNQCFIASQTDLKEYMDNMTEEIKVIPTNGTSADDVKYAKRVEEVYIDGIDVAGCNFRLEREGKQKCECCHATGFGVICDCENWHNCYYKQIKRLEQENKELKEVKEQLKKWNDENLKQQDDMQKWIDLAEEQRKNYRSALEEILESAKFAQCLPCGSGNLEDCLNCNDDITNNGQFCMEKRIHDIKTKCVEVLNHSEC